MKPSLDRRRWLQRALAAGALPLAWPAASLAVAGAALGRDAESQERLVVVMLRGALDGLAAVPVTGDPAWARLRPSIEDASARDPLALVAPLALTGPYGLHPKLAALHAWFREGSLLVAHAVASPYRERSHFDAQQLLESGGARPFELSTGWLGRALHATRGQGVALGAGLPLALRGADGATSWMPSDDAPSEAEWLDRVARLYRADARLAAAFTQAREQRLGVMGDTSRGEAGGGARGTGSFVTLAAHAGRLLANANGPSVAWLDVSGWDTHTQQVGRLLRMFEGLDQGLAALRASLGSHWTRTAVLVLTEFGRSAAMNGSGGTDHGTASVALLAGGRVAGGRVWSDWPGLGASQLHQGRDLRPTLDLRALLKPVLQRQLKVTTAALERDVLPGAPAGLPDLWRA